MDLYDLEQNFGFHYPPKILVELLDFQNSYYDYAKGFGLFREGTLAIQHLSLDPEFLNGILCFANDGAGSTFAVWDDNTGKDIKEMPVIVIGNMEGMHVVADNVAQLLQLLTCDIAIAVDKDQAYFKIDKENNEKSLHHDDFIKWLNDHFQIAPTDEPNKIIIAAHKKFKIPFDNWLLNF